MFVDIDSMTFEQLRNELLRSKEVLRQLMGRYPGQSFTTAYLAVAESERVFRLLADFEEDSNAEL